MTKLNIFGVWQKMYQNTVYSAPLIKVITQNIASLFQV